MNHYGNGRIVLNDWTAVRVTVGLVYGMTEREGFENPTFLSWLRFKDTLSCITCTKPCLPMHKYSVAIDCTGIDNKT